MKSLVCLFSLLIPAVAFAAEAAPNLDVAVSGIPAGASEVVIVVDTVAPPMAPGADDPFAGALPPPQAIVDQVQGAPKAAAADPAAPAADPAAAPQRRRRRGGAGGFGFGAPTSPPPFRQAVATEGATSVTAHLARPAGDNYRVRVVAIRDGDSLPAILAGDHAAGLKLAADHVAPVSLSLKSPALQLSPDNPTSVAAGAKFTLAGKITDAAQSLGTKNRMRVWISENAPPAKNHAGTQISTVAVTTKGDDVEFSFALTAPKTPGTIFLQFGEIPPDFARDDGTQAPLLVLPDLASGSTALQLRVDPAPASLSKL